MYAMFVSGGRAVGEAQVEDGDLPALPPRLANGRRPGNGGVGPLVLERCLDAESDDAVIVDDHDLCSGVIHRASRAPGSYRPDEDDTVLSLIAEEGFF